MAWSCTIDTQYRFESIVSTSESTWCHQTLSLGSKKFHPTGKLMSPASYPTAVERNCRGELVAAQHLARIAQLLWHIVCPIVNYSTFFNMMIHYALNEYGMF